MGKRILITGFDPFGGETVNPSWEAVKGLPDRINDWDLHKLELPTVFSRAAELAIAEAERIAPKAILCIGQAGGRDALTPEKVAINLRHGSIPDNLGQQPMDELIVSDGPCAYFATLPVREMATAMEEAGLPEGCPIAQALSFATTCSIPCGIISTAQRWAWPSFMCLFCRSRPKKGRPPFL